MQKLNSAHVQRTHDFYVNSRSIPRDTRWAQGEGNVGNSTTQRDLNLQPDDTEHQLVAEGGGKEASPWRITARAPRFDSSSTPNESDIQSYGVCKQLDNWRKRFNDKQDNLIKRVH